MGCRWGIGLNYNSQNWRLDSSGTWNYGRDVGYGYGVKLGAGSMQLYFNAQWGYDHWTFTDSTGAEYRLDQQVDPATGLASPGSNVWVSSTDGVAVLYDANLRRLYFPSGIFWQFDCASQGIEGDETARYPTLMQDTNGNQILIRYKPAIAGFDTSGNNVYLTWGNSSSRIDQIEDVRGISVGGYVTYQFAYNNDVGVPHLTGITNLIGTSEGYSFDYYPNVALTSPWGAGFGVTSMMKTVTIAGVGLNYLLTYDSNDGYGSALTKVKFPYGGYLRWAYADGTYQGGRSQREVLNRYLSTNGTSELLPYGFSAQHDSALNTIRSQVTLNDASTVGRKIWTFQLLGLPGGKKTPVLSTYQGGEQNGSVLQNVSTAWETIAANGAVFGPYISSTTTTMDGVSAKRVDQTQDLWGNLTRMKVYDINSATVRRQYDQTYLNDSAHTQRYIRNRMIDSKVTEAGVQTTLVTNVYDNYGPPVNNPIVNVINIRQFDSATSTPSLTARGIVTSSTTLGGLTYLTQIDVTGNVLQSYSSNGVGASSNVNSNTNYAAPSSVTVGSLTSSFQYAADLLPTQATGPNGDSAATVYDSYARPTSTTSKTGAVTYFNYTPTAVITYTNPNINSVGRVTRTTLDGFGRPVTVETGTGTYSNSVITLSAWVSIMSTEYAPCGCSPLGKLSRTSRPYAVNGTVYWTVYTYDGIGRTKTVKAPDGASTTTYGYAGAVVTVTDPAGKWKTFTTDAPGNLTQVVEPDPNLGNVYTYYTYDVLNQLRTVSMPRGGTTQTRTFTYAAWSNVYGVLATNGVGPFLMTATNPENGTVTNTYSGTQLASKVDAKGQKIAYTYDSYKRVTQVSKYPDGTNEDACQRVTYNYDSDPDAPNYLYSQYLAGRLGSVHYAGAGCSSGGNNYVDAYAYSQAGQVTRKTFRLTKGTASGDLEAVYTYDSEGKMLSQSYPLGTTYNYTYDTSGRPTKMTDATSQQDLVSTVSYGPAGELLSMSGTSVNESRTYNSMGQVTQITGIGMTLQYNYPAAGANNGQIASQRDLLTTGETISYQYDSLKRLTSATSTLNWGQGFTYDGFGNLTAKTALMGNPPVGSYPVDPATNRLAGGGYDANGNYLVGNYDVSNRLVLVNGTAGAQGLFEYDASNKRVMQQKQHYNGSNWVVDSTEYYFYGPGGKKLGTYAAAVGGSITWTLQTKQMFFGDKMLSRASGVVQEDVRGSVGEYYPYGEDKATASNDAVKFATYTRDSISGMDYGVNRYHMPGSGRFSSPDPYAGSGGVVDPGSWNRYAYAGGDPIDGNDPFGEFTCHFQSYVKNGEEHGALHVSATCSTAYADMGWAANYGSIFQSYSIDFRPGSGTTTEQAEAYAKSLEQKYEMGIFNSYLRSQAKRAVSEISNDCDSVLQWAGISPSALANSALSVNFYDGTQSYNGQQSMAAWGNYPPTSVSWYLDHVSNAFVDTNTYNDVMLGPSALPWSNGFNPMTLVHELLHTYTGLGDVALANRLGCLIVGGCSTDNASFFIKGILDQGCHKLWATIQQKN